MTKDEERSLGVRIAAGDLNAEHELVDAYRAYALARARHKPSFCLLVGRCEDLEAISTLSLIQAAHAYDPESHGNCLFITFARHRIISACSKGCSLCNLHRSRAIVDPDQIVDNRVHVDRDPEVIEIIEHVCPPHEADLVVAHIGLTGHPPVPLVNIAKTNGVTKQAISHRYREAIDRLRDHYTIFLAG